MHHLLKFFGLLILMLLIDMLAKPSYAGNQKNRIDSLQNVLKNEVIDTLRIHAALNLAINYAHIDPQKALEYAEISLEWAQKIKNTRLIAKANNEALFVLLVFKLTFNATAIAMATMAIPPNIFVFI